MGLGFSGVGFGYLGQKQTLNPRFRITGLAEPRAA